MGDLQLYGMTNLALGATQFARFILKISKYKWIEFNYGG
jgi:hypothetical protein